MKRKSALRRSATRWAKPFELFGRRVLQVLLSLLLWAKKRPAFVPEAPKILVVRLDARVGNLLLLTPLLGSLRKTWPRAQITVLCHESMRRVYAHEPHVDALIPYVKWQLGHGPFSLLQRLRALRFDLAIDAGSHPGVAVTHPLITRLAGARLTLGPQRGALSRLYNVVVPVLPEEASDIDQRLQLLAPFSHAVRVREMCFASPSEMQALRQRHAEFLRAAAPHGASATVLCVVGARMASRRIPEACWSDIVAELRARGLHATIVWGPEERALAERIGATTGASLAPPSSLDEIAALFSVAHGVIGHDTGTSHLAVAAGARTFVMFTLETPMRYGHKGPGRTWVDLREGACSEAILPPLARWLSEIQVVQ